MCGTVTEGLQWGWRKQSGDGGGLDQCGDNKGDEVNRVKGYLGDKCQQDLVVEVGIRL